MSFLEIHSEQHQNYAVFKMGNTIDEGFFFNTYKIMPFFYCVCVCVCVCVCMCVCVCVFSYGKKNYILKHIKLICSAINVWHW